MPDTFVVSERYQGHWFGGEARLMMDVVDGLQLSVGAESSASVRARLRGNSREDGVTSPYLAEDAPYRLHAGYALLNWRTSPWLTVSLGGRVDSWSTFGATLNPRLALLLRPTRRDTFKLMGGRAFRAPSVYELRYNDGGVTQVSSRYDGYKLGPELVWSSELEYTRTFADGWSALAAGHFQYAESLIEQVQLTSLRATGAVEQGVVRYQNRGNSVLIAGGDLEVRREFAAGWMFAANYTYLFAGATRARGNMARVPNVPIHAASVRGVVPLGARLRVAMRTTFEGPRKRLDKGHLETKMVVITDLVLSGELARPNLDYALGLYNLFDWRYALPTDPTFLTPTMPQPGRTLLASVTFRL